MGTFGLDVHQDLLSAVTGVPVDEELGTRLYGKDAVALRIDTTPYRLGDLADHLKILYLENTYREHFPWVDNIAEVRGLAKRTELDQALVDSIRGGDSTFELSPPEIVDWSQADHFEWDGHSANTYSELRINDYYNLIGSRINVSLEDLRKDKVRLYNADGNRIGGWSTYRCLNGELARPDGLFVLSDGKWYRVDPDFAAEVDDAVARLQTEAIELSAYLAADEDEGAYNQRIADASGGALCCMDECFVWPRSWQDRIEFCDLYRGDLTMVHVKRFSGGSATLSHLFA